MYRAEIIIDVVTERFLVHYFVSRGSGERVVGRWLQGIDLGEVYVCVLCIVVGWSQCSFRKRPNCLATASTGSYLQQSEIRNSCQFV